MTKSALIENHQVASTATHKSNQPKPNIQKAQESIYRFLLDTVKRQPPEVLQEFRNLFIHHHNISVSSNSFQSVYEIALHNNEEEFRYTIKRSCYILINNWDAKKESKYIRELIEIFDDPIIKQQSFLPIVNRIRRWVKNFLDSKDYQELKLFAARYEEQSHWSDRYTSHLLVAQYADINNSVEQREIAQIRAEKLKYQFKMDLAMYIARSQSPIARGRSKNPTQLGDEVLRFIKIIVAKRGSFSYANIADIFIKQTRDQKYQQFKQSLYKYLIFRVGNREFVEILEAKLSKKLAHLYEKHHEEILSDALLLRTCNCVIDYLTTENGREPSPLFIAFMSQCNFLTLVIVLVKIILVCRHARTHLETCIANLVQYYKNYPEEECQRVITFLEVFNVVFAICAENVQYNLIKMQENDVGRPLEIDLDSYRIFSQLKGEKKLEMVPVACPS